MEHHKHDSITISNHDRPYFILYALSCVCVGSTIVALAVRASALAQTRKYVLLRGMNVPHQVS